MYGAKKTAPGRYSYRGYQIIKVDTEGPEGQDRSYWSIARDGEGTAVEENPQLSKLRAGVEWVDAKTKNDTSEMKRVERQYKPRHLSTKSYWKL